MRFAILLTAALLLSFSAGCKSPSSSDVPCNCGTALGEMEGCAHSLCIDGEQNPANPDCVCGTISIPAGTKE